jgi:hypothetical protein
VRVGHVEVLGLPQAVDELLFCAISAGRSTPPALVGTIGKAVLLAARCR